MISLPFLFLAFSWPYLFISLYLKGLHHIWNNIFWLFLIFYLFVCIFPCYSLPFPGLIFLFPLIWKVFSIYETKFFFNFFIYSLLSYSLLFHGLIFWFPLIWRSSLYLNKVCYNVTLGLCQLTSANYSASIDRCYLKLYPN